MRLVHKILARWFKRVPSNSPLIAAPVCPDWTSEDADQFAAFLRSPTGDTLIKRARALECANAIKACQQTPLAASRAAGFSDCVNWLTSLAGARPDNEQTPATAQGETQRAEKELAID